MAKAARPTTAKAALTPFSTFPTAAADVDVAALPLALPERLADAAAVPLPLAWLEALAVEEPEPEPVVDVALVAFVPAPVTVLRQVPLTKVPVAVLLGFCTRI